MEITNRINRILSRKNKRGNIKEITNRSNRKLIESFLEITNRNPFYKGTKGTNRNHSRK